MEFEKISAPSLKDLFVKQIQGMILSGELAQGTALPPERELARQMQVRRALEQLAAGLVLRNATDKDIDRLGDLVAHIAGAQTPQQAAERAFEFQHELALISGNSILPLFYCSFRTPTIVLWVRFCRRYGIEALCRNTRLLYTHLKNRDEQQLRRWIETYLGEAIEGCQQIYSE